VNQDILKGQWRQMKGEARKAFGKLTDDDMEVIGGHIDSFIGTVQERYGYTREQASDQVRKFADNFRNDYPDTWDSWYGDTRNDFERGVDNAVHGVKNAANDVANGVRNTANDIEREVQKTNRNW
jgi:uncharacterized protein YjbJ (UPF0337 family)